MLSIYNFISPHASSAWLGILFFARQSRLHTKYILGLRPVYDQTKHCRSLDVKYLVLFSKQILELTKSMCLLLPSRHIKVITLFRSKFVTIGLNIRNCYDNMNIVYFSFHRYFFHRGTPNIWFTLLQGCYLNWRCCVDDSWKVTHKVQQGEH